MGRSHGIELQQVHDAAESDTTNLIGDSCEPHAPSWVRAGASGVPCPELPPIFRGEHENDDDGMAIHSVEFYSRDCFWSALVYCAYVCSAGLLALLGRWLPHRSLKLTHSRCDASSADRVLVHGSDGRKTVANLVRSGDRLVPPFFDYRHVRHYLCRDDFPAPAAYQVRQPVSAFHEHLPKGLSEEEVVIRQRLVGCNLVKVPVKPHLVLLVEEVLNPFYVFQVWSVTIWMLDDYFYYAMCVACISISSALISLVSTRRNLERISDMAYHQANVRVLRNSTPLIVSSNDLVPGDIVLLQPQDTVPADLLLLSGSVIVDESMLTGESVPVVKTALPPPANRKEGDEDDVVCPMKHKGSTLLCGTQVVDVSPGETHQHGTGAAFSGGEAATAAVVIRTGFLTAKGSLVRSILFPKETSNDFFKDSVRFICALAALASIGMIYQSAKMSEYGASLKHLILGACDIVTIAVPPALPAAICIGLEMAMARCRLLRIYCTSPARINPAGQLEIVCFDKTGTITTDRIDVVGCALCSGRETPRAVGAEGRLSVGGEGSVENGSSKRQEVEAGALVEVRDVGWQMLSCLALCHSLVPAPAPSVSAESGPADWDVEAPAGRPDSMGRARRYIGDPLELATFAATGASLCERLVFTSGGRSLTTPVITFPASHARRILESARKEGLVVQTRDPGVIGGDELHLLDEGAPERGPGATRASVHPGAKRGSSTPIADDVHVHVAEVDSGATLAAEGAPGDTDEWSQVASPPCAHGKLAEVEVCGEVGGRRAGGRGQAQADEVERAAVLRRFAFTSEALRSSVVVAFQRVPGTYVYVKGAPEVLSALCEAATLPPNLAEEVSCHTRNGRRVLACAYRACGAAGAEWALEAARADVEQRLVWGGLLVMENTLKADSKQAIDDLTAAGLHCTMVTGDHALTAISVARRCGILAPCRTVLLCAVVGEDGGGSARPVGDGRRPEDAEVSSQTQDVRQATGADKLVFTRVEPLRQDKTSGVCGGKGEGGKGGGGQDAALSTGREEARGPAEAAEVNGPSDSAGRKALVLGVTTESRQACMGIEEAYEAMAGGWDVEVGADEDQVEEAEVAMTGAALDILLQLSCSWDTADGLHAGAGRGGGLIDRGAPRAGGVEGGNSLWRLLSGRAWWNKVKDAGKEGHTGRKRRVWGPPGLYQNRRGSRRAGGVARGLPTSSPPTSPSLSPTAGAPPIPASISPAGALSPATFESKTHEEMAREVICRARVFARCSPVHKQELVTALALELPATVAFCGDGANDCGALKAAHVGLSLSDAESSIAAPFTSSTQSIRAMVDLIREGRAALVSSVASFKFMAMYSLTQLISVLRLYQVNATLTDGMFLWVDLFLVLPFVVTMSQTGAAKGLAWLRPQGRLVSPAVLASIIGQVLLVIIFQVLVARATHQMPFFDCDPLCQTLDTTTTSMPDNSSAIPVLPNNSSAAASGVGGVQDQDLHDLEVHGGGELCWAGTGPMPACCRSQPLGCPTRAIHANPKVNSVSVEATAAFLLSQYQYLAALIAFSSGAPYRLPAYTNYWLIFNLAIAVVVCLVLTFAVEGAGPLTFIVDMIRLVPFPDPTFPGRLLLISLAGIGSACALESAIAHADDLLALGLSSLDRPTAAMAGSGAGARADFRNCRQSLRMVLANGTRQRVGGSCARVGLAAVVLVVCMLAALLVSF